ncbi:hypothetical protein [Myceligenerans crystallogenes]|uniref:Uncharacterized protein n=1 Tax=Myceligenerans crystallogenes TaxID=316335 RepID=A0ABN2NQ97_9MICO
MGVYTDRPDGEQRHNDFARLVTDAEDGRFDGVVIADSSRIPDNSDVSHRLFDAVDVIVRCGPAPPPMTSPAQRLVVMIASAAITLLYLQVGLTELFNGPVGWDVGLAAVGLLTLLSRGAIETMRLPTSATRTGIIIALVTLTAAILILTAFGAARVSGLLPPMLAGLFGATAVLNLAMTSAMAGASAASTWVAFERPRHS